jgi:hypothetical protein
MGPNLPCQRHRLRVREKTVSSRGGEYLIDAIVKKVK